MELQEKHNFIARTAMSCVVGGAVTALV